MPAYVLAIAAASPDDVQIADTPTLPHSRGALSCNAPLMLPVVRRCLSRRAVLEARSPPRRSLRFAAHWICGLLAAPDRSAAIPRAGWVLLNTSDAVAVYFFVC